MKSADYFPRVAVGAVIFKDDKILLVKRSNPPAKNLWAIPGGKIEPGESIKQALKREIREETGLEIDVGEPVHVFDVIEKKDGAISFHYVIIDFECRPIAGSLHPGDDADEVRWFSQSQLKDYNISRQTLQLLRKKYNFSSI